MLFTKVYFVLEMRTLHCQALDKIERWNLELYSKQRYDNFSFAFVEMFKDIWWKIM